METGYQRGKIQEEPLLRAQEARRLAIPSSASTPSATCTTPVSCRPSSRDPSTEEEKQSQLKRLADFHARNKDAAPVQIEAPAAGGDRQPERVRRADGRRACAAGQITNALFEVGGSTGAACRADTGSHLSCILKSYVQNARMIPRLVDSKGATRLPGARNGRVLLGPRQVGKRRWRGTIASGLFG